MSAALATDTAPARLSPEAPPAPEEPEPPGPPLRPGRNRRTWADWTAAGITLAVLAGAVALVAWALHPNLILRNTTAAGGDMGAHVWGPAYLRDHLLPHGRISGWAPDWYAGFPALAFYFPLPSLLIVLVGTVIPYNVAFKLVTVLGLLALPVAAWAFGRLSRMRYPGPVLLGLATVPFLFERGSSSHPFQIYGGNIASTMAGEFSFSISLAVGLVFLGLVCRGLNTGRGRGIAAAALAVTGLCHLLPALFVLAGVSVLVLLRPGRRQLRFVSWTLVLGGLIAAIWVLPFAMRLGYTNDMGWEAITKWSEQTKDLFLPSMKWAVALAAVGASSSVALWVMAVVTEGISSEAASRRRAGVLLTALALLSAAAFHFNALPGQLWNARALPFWYLSVFLLAGVAVAEATGAVASLLASDPDRPHPAWGLAAPVVSTLLLFYVVGLPLGIVPKPVRLITTNDHNYVVDWSRWNYSGYQDKGKARRDEYFNLMDTMRQVGQADGCGRAHWEYEGELDQMGTPLALMLLPYWTHGCIASMEGLYFESSATTPYHFLNAALLSKAPSNPQRHLPYGSLDVAAGVKRLQLFGVRYYMALTPEAQAQADRNPDLIYLRSSASFPVSYKDGVKQRTWKVYEVAGSDVVAPLQYQPAVLTGVSHAYERWQGAAVAFYQQPSAWDVPLAASGPSSWQRVPVQVHHVAVPAGQEKLTGSDVTLPTPDRIAVRPATISDIRTTDDRISFDVDQPGSPVLVKASYFPNWQASGAKGPWRVAPNLMVVIPTAHHVSLHYGWTPVDAGGLVLTLLGLALAAVFTARELWGWVVPAEALRFRGDAEEGLPTPVATQLSFFDEATHRSSAVAPQGEPKPDQAHQRPRDPTSDGGP